ncbi:hypothetical protein PG993_012820 [Apiospora rasikravindrae]|uniref:Uncharacterized protein n=1 Tax=Apiospora rasikravindrae TaxID=990691 RepID=A0ABR1RW03_9PEZI
MCNRFRVRLLCGHRDVGYDFCSLAVTNAQVLPGPRRAARSGSMLPCRNVHDDLSMGPLDVTYKCKVRGCYFEAVERSWLCCKCWSRPNTRGICAGLQGSLAKEPTSRSVVPRQYDTANPTEIQPSTRHSSSSFGRQWLAHDNDIRPATVPEPPLQA